MYVCTYASMYVCTYAYMYVCIYEYTNVLMYIFMCVCMYIRMCAFMYVCVYVCIYECDMYVYAIECTDEYPHFADQSLPIRQFLRSMLYYILVPVCVVKPR